MKSTFLILIFLAYSLSIYAQPATDTSYQPKFDLEKYFNPTLTEEQRKQYKDAVYSWSQKIHADTLNAQAYLNRGAAYFNLGLYPYAINDFSKTIKLNPTIPEAYYNRGLARARFSYNKEACQDIKKAADLGLEPAGELFDNKCGRYANEINSQQK